MRITPLLLTLVACPAWGDDKPADPLAKHDKRKVEGFTVLVSPEVAEQEAKTTWKVKPLAVLEKEFQLFVKIMPAKYVDKLRAVPVRYEWQGTDKGIPDWSAAYFTTHHAGLGQAIVILKGHDLVQAYQPPFRPTSSLLLHEFAHAVDYIEFKSKNPKVRAAYEQAMERKLYGDKPESGKPGKIYASTNAGEYFAELSCAYLDRCKDVPHTRDELKKHDPEGFRVMDAIWGDGSLSKPEAGTAESAAELRLNAVKKLVGVGQDDYVKTQLGDLLKQFPGTPAAKEAQGLLDKMKK